MKLTIIRPIYRAMAYNFGLSFVINMLSLVLPIYSLQVLDRVLSSQSLETLMMLTLVALLVYGVLSLLSGVRSFVFVYLSQWLDITLSPKVIRSSLSGVSQESGLRVNGLLRDVAAVKQFATGQVITTLFDLPWVIVFLAVIGMIHPYPAVVTLIGAAVLVLLAWGNEWVTAKTLQSVNQQFSDNVGRMGQMAQHSDVMTSMGFLPHMIHHWSTRHQKVLDTQSRVIKQGHLIASITKFVRLVIQLSSTALSAYLVLQSEMTAGGIIAISILSGKVLAPFDQAIVVWKSVVHVRQAYTRVNQALMDLKERETIELPVIKGALSCDHVFYAFPGKEISFLSDIHFTIQPGKSVGIVGPSGSGKTTLSKLLAGALAPSRGTVRIDGADCLQLMEVQRFSSIGYMPQQVGIMEGSIRDNIARFSDQITDEQVIAAAHYVGIHELILSFPNGYQCEVGPNGTYLSAGQRQLIGLARACLGHPKLVILDEPNANLDSMGEVQLMALLGRLKHDQVTVVMISHRPALMQQMDRLIVLREGGLVMDNSADKVMATLSGKLSPERSTSG